MSGVVELITNTAAYVSGRWRDATDPETVLTSLSVAQSEIVILPDADADTASTGAYNTSESSPSTVANGNGVISVPLTDADLNFTGFATIVVKPAAALEKRFRVHVVSKLTNTAANDAETDTQDLQAQIGAAGAGLTAVPWNASWDTEVESEVTDALNAYDPPTRTEATADKDEVLTAVGTAQDDLDILTGSDGVTLATSQPNYAPNTTTPPTAGAIADAVWDEATADHTTAGTFGKAVADILGKWSGITTLAGWLRLMLRSDDAVATDHATELTEINNDEGSGSGDYDNTTDAQEAAGADLSQIAEATEAPLLLQTTVDTVTSQTQFTLTDGLATADVYNGLLAVIVDTDTPSTNRARVKVEDYDGATKTVYLEAAPSYTIAAGDAVTILAAKEFDATGVTISSFEQAALNQLANTDVEIVGIVSAGGGLQIIQGDDYVDDELVFTETAAENWPDLDDEDTVVSFSAIKQGEDEDDDNTIYVEGEVVTATGSSKQVTFDLTHAINNKDAGTYSYHIRAWILNGAGDDWIKRTLRRGQDKMAIVEEYQADTPDVPTP